MAIFSLHHTPVGKSTQAQPYTAAAHVRYITRREAMSRVEAARMPASPGRAIKYMRAGEDGDRANARVADKVMLALPRELDATQRVALVRAFAEEVTKGKASWLAAFHDKGEDRRNPHCHLVIRDRDPQTGRRVIGMSEAGSTEMLREAWERRANMALKAAGRPERIDRRSLSAQGIKRAPTIHEGPRAREMDARGAAPRSKSINARNGRGAKRSARRVDYRKIDAGMSRPAYNRSIRQAQSEAEYWDAIDADTRRRDLEALGYDVSARDERRPGGEAVAKRPKSARPESFSQKLARERGDGRRDAQRVPDMKGIDRRSPVKEAGVPSEEPAPSKKRGSFSGWLRSRDSRLAGTKQPEQRREPERDFRRKR